MPDIKSMLRSYVDENITFGSSARSYGDADSFMDKHILDSTGFLEVIAFLEESFGIQVSDEEMTPENLDSIDNLAAFVARKTSA
jgi:acyl carrier protein